MATITMYICNTYDARVKMAFISEEKGAETARQLLKDGAYEKTSPIVVEQEGVNAAEEAFDLTNNPSRDDERQEKYGNGPSLSSGDIVDVDGTLYLCCSIGWSMI